MIPGIVAARRSAPPIAGLSTRWRINASGKGFSGSYCAYTEVEMASEPGGPDLTTGGSASASTYQASGAGVPNGGFVAPLAFDNVLTNDSSWTAANSAMPQWIEYAFPVAVTIEEVRAYPKVNDPGGTPNIFDVQYFDGSSWLTYWSESFPSGLPFANKKLVFTRNRGRRKWRLNLTDKGLAGAWFTINEIYFRATAGGPDISDSGLYYASMRPSDVRNAFDRTSSTWQSGSSAAPVQIGCYFPTDVPMVNEIVITGGGTATDSPTAGQVQYYDESTSEWVTAWSFSGLVWAANETKTITKP